MPQPESQVSLDDGTERPDLIQRLILGRLALIFILLLASWWWTSSYLQQPIEAFPTSLFLLLLVSIGLTGAYYVVSVFNRNFTQQRRVQFFIDVLLVTWLVRETGDITSPYVSLYSVLICIAGFMLGRIETHVVAAACAVSFTGLAILTAQDIIYSISGDTPVSRSFQIVAWRVVAILFVGLMAGRIAERKRIGQELKQSRESFADLNILHERIVQSVHTGLITTDLDGKIYAFNSAAERILERAPTDVIGKSVLEICGDDLRDHVERCFGAVQDNAEFTEHFETELPTGSGNTVSIAYSVSPLFRRTGDVSGLIFVFQDLSRVRALEASLRRADRLAAVGRMAAGLAHEVRNPLGSLSSSLQFLREKIPGNSSERSLFDVVLRESDRLNDIITDFLSYAKPSADVLSEKRDTDIDAALRDCLVLLKHNPKVTDAHQFNYEPPSRPVHSRISETNVKQVMWNLLQNSINAMPHGGDITVSLREVAGGRVQLQFHDSGPGFSPENLEHLYEPFAVSATGTGLGLSIVHKIVNEHGGRIDINSSNGDGATIVVELPR